MSQPSATPTADAAEQYIKTLFRDERLTPPLSQAAPAPSMLPVLLVVCFIVGLLVRDNPALIIGGMGLVVAIAWKSNDEAAQLAAAAAAEAPYCGRDLGGVRGAVRAGAALGVDFTFISKVENGHTRPGKPVLHRLLAWLEEQAA